MQIQLRPYQKEAVDGFFGALPKYRRQLVSLPTGAGKTIVIGTAAHRYYHEVDSTRPIVVIAHRSELLDQADQKIRLVWPDVFTGRVQGSQNEQLGEIMLASTQTLVAGRAIRQPGLVIYDEAHHVGAPGTLRMLERLGVFEPGGPPLLGVTATPQRGDGVKLGDVFEHLAYERTILQMIADGYLSDVRGVKVEVPDLNLSAIRTSGGDYNAKDLSYVLNFENALDAVVVAVRTHAANRKCLVFAVDVKHANALAERFKQAGMTCAAVDGGMAAEQRSSILKDFAENRLRILVNCQILTEGYDQPDVDAVVIARPTRSQSLYTQMVGRALRLHPSKSDAMVLDLTGASQDKSLQTFTVLMKTQRRGDQDATQVQAKSRAKANQEELPMQDGESVTEWVNRVDQVTRAKQEKSEQVAQAINLFANRSRYRWNKIKDMFAICYDDSRWAYLFRDGDEYWPVLELKNEKFMPLHDRALPLEYAQGIAEGFLQLLETKLIEKEADWRSAPMSKRQAYLLDQYRIQHDKTWTRGAASDALTQAFSRKRVRILGKNFDAEYWRSVLATESGKAWLEARINRFKAYAEAQARAVVQ
ncbi:DEAD/DEAH box helicase [Alicyclobacillus sp. ALC3]|uniref:DEAD/DEAH box helicase n=1 Tax=Alicyclobacillus sp. ALC3 TaxID=2796143 RepID=UPI002379BB73|nr:DEAD/DEAH box helicase [Alicyclobacillus sp. ALC3]WDL99759.1 DEAD/DEAH box helicase [Alicyclobacillus sp. ALC3]